MAKRSLYVSPLALTIILALLTGVVALAVWALLMGHFNPSGTPAGAKLVGSTGIAVRDLAERMRRSPARLWVSLLH